MGRKETKSIPVEDQRKTKQPSRKRHRTKSMTYDIVTNHLKFNKPVTDHTQGKVKKKKEALTEMLEKNKLSSHEIDNKVTEEMLKTQCYQGYKRDRISAETEGPLHDKHKTEDENKGSYIKHDNKHNDSKHTHENIGGGGGENEKETESGKDDELEEKYDSEGKRSSKEKDIVKHEMKISTEEVLNKLICQIDGHLLDDIGDLVDEGLDIDVHYLGEHYKKQKVSSNTAETGNKLDISKMVKMQVERGDSEKSVKNGKDVSDRIDDKSRKEVKDRKNRQNINSVWDTDKNERPLKQTVDLPPDDNRYRKPDSPGQEETRVKTIRTLLVLDADKEKEKGDNSKEKEDQPKNWLENSTSTFDNQCRSSLDGQEDENCRSFQSEDSLEQEGEENSCSFSEDYFPSYLHSYAGSEYAESLSCQSAPPLGNKSDALWEKTQEVVTWTSVVKDDAQSGDEEKGDGLTFTSLRVTELQEENDITTEEVSGGGELIDDRGTEELSEKEKIISDEKDVCQESDTDSVQADENSEAQAEQKGTETTAEVEALPVDICASLVPAMKSDIKEEAETGLATAEDLEIVQDNGCRIENETEKICAIVQAFGKFQQDIVQIHEGASMDRLRENRESSPICLDTLYYFITCNLCKQCGLGLPGSITFLLCKIAVETPQQKKLLGSPPFESYTQEEPTKQHGRDQQRSYLGQQSSRTKFTKGKRRRNAYVKYPKRRIIKDKPTSSGAGGSWRLPWLRGAGTCGRRCSDGSGGSAGGSFHHNSGGSDKKGAEGSGNWDRNNNGHHNNNYNDGSNNSGDRKGSSDGNGSRKRPSQSDPEKETSNVPDQDFKRYRKKHTVITLDDFMSFLGQHRTLIEEIKGPVWEQIDNPIPDCLSLSLEKPDEVSEELLNCDVCSIINSMMKHFADCEKQYVVCTMCIQMFSFICIHAYDCKKNGYQCEIALCVKFYQVVGEDTIHGRMKCLWFNIKKKLARVLGFDDGIMTSTSAVPVNPPNLPSIGGARSYNPSLASIPENTEGSSSRSGSRVLARKPSNKLPSVHETESLPPDRPASGELTDSSGEAAAAEYAPQQPTVDLVYRQMTPRKISSSQLFSLPVTGGVEGHHGQYPSFTDKPVGTPGICEVMYGNIQQLVKVGKNWSELKAMFQRDEPLPRPYREEGIILRPFQEYLLITGLRYQINFQWLKVSHLGNGMSGKCHLATDFQTDFKFCVKEIHINNFEVEEIELWSDLEHPYIVKLYGAIRHGEMVYIFSEFIDGGNLTEAINTQRALNKRLSHITALMLFKQLLEVLVYLKEKHILHEDLKADNILLHREKDSISIKVTDFGSATRINASVRVGTKPVGTMTQWSPEKAECVGYGYPAEVWAAVCVLVHMVSGLPPWMRRYGGLKSLIVVIVQKSPPVEDIPRNIPKCVRDLIERGFTVCQGQRPTPEDLLRHEAFRLITDTRPRTDAYSILDSTFHLDNTELEHKNEDLQEIIKSLDKRKKSAVHMTESVDRLTSGLNSISFQGPGQVPQSTVAVIHGVERQPQQPSQNTVTDNGETTGGNRGEGQVGGEGQTASAPPSGQEGFNAGSQSMAQDENPLRHYLDYIVDDVNINNADLTVLPYQAVVPYQPGNRTQIDEIRVAIETEELENQALNTRLPNFEKILESSSGLSDDYDDIDDDNKDEPEAPFDFKSGHEKIVGKYLSPLPQDGVDPMIGATRIPLTVHSTESPDTESTLQEETRLSPTSKSSDSKTPNTDSSKLSDMDNRLPSGDDLFKSGPGDDLEILQGIQNLSVTPRILGPTANTIESPTGDERALFGNGSSGNSNTYDGQNTHQPVSPPMCSPSRNVDMLYSRPGVAERHFVSPQPNIVQSPVHTTTSDYGLSAMNRNSNANPFHPELQGIDCNPTSRLIETPTKRHMSEIPVAAPDRSRQPQYLYSNTGQRDIMQPENPGVTGPPANFVLGSQSGTSSSGSLSMSPVPQTQGSNNPYLQSGKDAQLSPAVPHIQLGRNSEMVSSTQSFATSTPVSIPRKRKQEKDAMNEMLKSFKVSQVERNPRQGDQSSQPPSSSFSPAQPPRQNLRLNVSSPHQPAETVPHVQSAPTLQRTPSYPADHHRLSGAPHSATPPKGTTQWPTEGPGSASASTSTRSQFEEQEQAFAELEREFSQHSHSESHLHLSLLEGDEENLEDTELREDSIPSDEAAREAIKKKYITEEEERKVTVSFVCDNENSPIKMKFTNRGRLWRQILDQDLCRSGIHTLFGCENFCLKFEDGTAVDLDMQLGDNDVTVTVVTASGDDPWCIEGGQLFFT